MQELVGLAADQEARHFVRQRSRLVSGSLTPGVPPADDFRDAAQSPTASEASQEAERAARSRDASSSGADAGDARILQVVPKSTALGSFKGATIPVPACT